MAPSPVGEHAVLEKLRDSDASSDQDAKEILLRFRCPGCQCSHYYRIKGVRDQPVWEWNQSLMKPTLHPSLVVGVTTPGKRCHLFLRDGILEFLSDCDHDLRDTKVPLDPVESPL